MDDEKNTFKKRSRLRVFNNGLTIVALLLGVYVMISPLLPEITWWVGQNTPIKTYADKAEDIREAANNLDTGSDNRLFIESLGMNEVIHEGGLEQLKYGVLRRQQTSTPDQGSNTVLVGHRFTYSNRGVFYHLDKVKVGDRIVMHWNGAIYKYDVEEILVVPPTQVSVEQPTEEDILTIYTCTPLWTAKERLVVRSKLIEEPN